MTSTQINQRYLTFMSQRVSIDDRYSSFDMCYWYFYHNRGKLIGKKLEESCLHLWAFLGSWGMITRGNALQGKSYSYLKKTIEFINKNPKYYASKIDSNNYVLEMMDLYKGLKLALNLSQKSQKTLISKIMLGVFACLPAFDQYVCETLRTSSIGDLSEENIRLVVNLYAAHKPQIDALSTHTPLMLFNGSYNKK